MQRFTLITLTQYRLEIYSYLDKAFIDEERSDEESRSFMFVQDDGSANYVLRVFSVNSSSTVNFRPSMPC
jgi:hypothetical protein